MTDKLAEEGEHRDDGLCWCENTESRELALDRLYPDRCQRASGPDVPSSGARHCVLPADHTGRACYGHMERQGGPCHFCGATYDGDMCPTCWTSLDGMSLADLKGIFATADLSIEVPR